MYKFNNVLLTGASGLLGSWVVEELIKNNKEVVGVALDDTKDDLLKYKNIFSPSILEVPPIFELISLFRPILLCLNLL